MARIRTIKPEFWTDEKIGEVSLPARLLLIGALNFADDHGGLDRSAKQLKAQIFPYDTIDCEPLVLELIRVGLFIEYQVADGKYLHIKGFHKHQKVDHPSKFPKTPPYEESPNAREQQSYTGDDSDKEKNAHGVLGSPRESSLSNVKEGNVVIGEGKKNRTAAKRAPTDAKSSSVPRETIPDWFLDFKLAYPERSGDPNWRGALRAAHARIAEGHLPAEFLGGAERYGEFCRVTGKIGTEFVKQAATFLGPGKPFLEPWTPPPTKADTRLRSNLSAADEFMRRTEDAA